MSKRKRGLTSKGTDYGFIESELSVICSKTWAHVSMNLCKLKQHQIARPQHPEMVGKPRLFFLRKKQLVMAIGPQNISERFARAGSSGGM